MTASPTWVIRCDRIVGGAGITCGAAVTFHVATVGAARALARDEGWTRHGTTDTCPFHARQTRTGDAPHG